MSDRSSHSAATLLVPVTMVIILLLCIVPYNPELPVETEIEYTGGMIETAIMVKDINSGGQSGQIDHLTAVGNTLYFSADDGTDGSELWKSDGTASGTVMVKDINSGGSYGLSIDSDFTPVGNDLYFRASDGVNGWELWKSDGTVNGTVMVKDIYGGVGSSYPSHLEVVGNTLYFQARDTANGFELWKSDGTVNGTVMVKDIVGGSGSSYPEELKAVGSTLYFSAKDSVGRELWKSDGTPSGTVMVKNIWTGSPGPGDSNPKEMVSIGNILYFQAESYDLDDDNVSDGVELWKSDGTTAGTVMVKNINTGSNWNGASDPIHLTTIGNTVYFQANDGSNGAELWKSDGTENGTVMVKNIYPDSTTSAPGHLTAVGNTLYFSADDGAHGQELWKSDGTDAGTVMVKDILSGNSSSFPWSLTAIGNTLYFRGNDGTYGQELWKSDGTANGTVMVKDINPSGMSSSINKLTAMGNALYFEANDGGPNGAELWRTIEYPEDAASADLEASLSIGDFGSGTGNSFLIWYNLTAITPGWDYTIEYTYEYASNGSWLGGNNPETFSFGGTSSNNGPIYRQPWNFDYSLGVEVCLTVSVYNGTSTASTSLLDSDTDCVNSPTWENIMLASGDGVGKANNNGNSIAIDDDGNIHVAYIDDSPGRGWLRYMKYDGSSWSDWTVDSSNDQIGYAASIAVDDYGDVHISYYDALNKNLKYAFFNGNNWTTTVIDGVGGEDMGLFTSIAIDRGDVAVGIAYFDEDNNSLKYAQYDGTSWEHTTVLSGNVGHWISLTFDSTGRPHIATRSLSSYSLIYVTWDSDWSYEIVDQNGDQGRYSSIAVDSDDGVHISYYDHTNTNLKYAYLDPDTVPLQWEIETVDDEFGTGGVGDLGKHSSIAIDSNDDIYISYYDETDTDLMIAGKNGGDDWYFEPVDTVGNVGKYSEITIDNNDIPNVIYYEDSIASKGLRFSCLGCSVNEPIINPTILVNLAYLPATGKLHAGYVLNALDENIVYSLERNLFFQFNSSTIVSDFVGIDCDCETLSEFINWEEGDTFSGNNFVITDDTAYCVELVLRSSDGTSTNVHDQKVSCANFPQIDDDELSWSTTTVPDASDDFGLYVDSALDSEGTPHYCYYDDENSNLKYATFDDDGWTIITVDGFLNSATSVEADVGGFCSIALDSEDHPHISYSDDTNNHLRFASEIVDVPNATTVWVSEVADTYPTSDTSLAFSSDGVPHISYWWEGESVTCLMYNNKTNGSWNPFCVESYGNINTTHSPVGSQTSITLSNTDAPFISYYQPLSQDMNVAFLGSEGWWTVDIDSEGFVGKFSSIMINPTNNAPYISYYDETNSALKIASYTSADGNGWDNYAVDSGGETGLYTSIMFNEDDHLSIAYFDNTSNSIRYTVYKDNEWNYHGVDDSGGAKHISLEINSDGEIYIAYYDTESAELKLSCNTCDFTPPGGNDTDGDGYTDDNDAFPLNSTEWIDTDGDGIGNNADTDDDNDGFLDVDDHFPLDPSEDKDADGDGIGNNADTDDDNDGWMDAEEISCGTLPQDSASVPIDANGNGICDTLEDDGGNGTGGNGTGGNGTDNNTGGGYLVSYDDGGVEVALSIADYDGIGVLFSSDSDGKRILSIEWYQEGPVFANTTVQIAVTEVDADGNVLQITTGMSTTISPNQGWNIWDTDSLSGNLFEFDGQDFLIIISGGSAGKIGVDTTDPKLKSYLCSVDCEFFLNSNLENIGASNEYNLMVRVEVESMNISIEDSDGDGVANDDDECPNNAANPPDDGDYDADGCPDSMDLDKDNDDVLNVNDNCVYSPLGWSTNDENPVVDWDHDGCRDADEDADIDGDGVDNTDDKCDYTLIGSDVDDEGCISSGDEDVVEEVESEEEPEGEWYSNIPVIGSQLEPIVEMVQTKYGKAISASVFVLTALGYAYRAVSVRSEMKMKKRMNKFEKRIDIADSDRELRKIERDVEDAEEKNLLPLGGYGDLMSMIENREEQLGIGEGSESMQMMNAASSMQMEMAESMQEMRETQEDIASMADSMRSSKRGPPQQSRSGPPGVAASAKPVQSSSGMSRPSYHPKDMDEDGIVSEEDLAKFNALSKAEQIARQSRASKDKGLTSEIVRFSKIPRSSKARCHCGSNKQYGKCHLKKDLCPCDSGKKFLKCCAKKRGFK